MGPSRFDGDSQEVWEVTERRKQKNQLFPFKFLNKMPKPRFPSASGLAASIYLMTPARDPKQEKSDFPLKFQRKLAKTLIFEVPRSSGFTPSGLELRRPNLTHFVPKLPFFNPFLKVFEGFRRFPRVSEAFRRFPKGFQWFPKVSNGFRWFPNV